MRKIRGAHGKAKWTLGVGRLQHQTPTRSQGGVAQIQQAQYIIFFLMLHHVQGRDEVKRVRMRLEKLKQVAFHHVGSYITRDAHLLRTDIDAGEVVETLFVKKKEQTA